MYEDALGIAEIYKLDTDLVYQKQWAAVPVSGDTLVFLNYCSSFQHTFIDFILLLLLL